MVQLPGLAGKRVAVTGAASGIGYEIARMLVDSGSKVAICDINPSAVRKAADDLPNLSVCVADVSSEAEVAGFFARVAADFGGLDALVNNAGIAGPTAKIEDVTAADWQRSLDVGLTGQFLCARSSVGMLRAAGGGAIVNMSSVAGKLGYALRSPYSAVKFGVVGLTQCWAKELGPANIRVNALLPGPVRGRRIQEVIDARAEALEADPAEVEASLVCSVSLRRMVEPTDVAAMTAFLISDLGKNISGQSIAVDANVETI